MMLFKYLVVTLLSPPRLALSIFGIGLFGFIVTLYESGILPNFPTALVPFATIFSGFTI